MTESLRHFRAQAFYAGSPLLLIPDKLAAKGETGEGQRCAEAGVENGDERIWRKMRMVMPPVIITAMMAKERASKNRQKN